MSAWDDVSLVEALGIRKQRASFRATFAEKGLKLATGPTTSDGQRTIQTEFVKRDWLPRWVMASSNWRRESRSVLLTKGT